MAASNKLLLCAQVQRSFELRLRLAQAHVLPILYRILLPVICDPAANDRVSSTYAVSPGIGTGLQGANGCYIDGEGTNGFDKFYVIWKLSTVAQLEVVVFILWHVGAVKASLICKSFVDFETVSSALKASN